MYVMAMRSTMNIGKFSRRGSSDQNEKKQIHLKKKNVKLFSVTIVVAVVPAWSLGDCCVVVRSKVGIPIPSYPAILSWFRLRSAC